MKKLCNEVLNLLDNHLIRKEKTDNQTEDSKEAIVFYLRMKGDYNRYLSEVVGNPQLHKFMV